jgi:hypothetical protein
VFLLGGFGGTAGLHAPWAAAVLAEHLVGNLSSRTTSCSSGDESVVLGKSNKNAAGRSEASLFHPESLPARFGLGCWVSPQVVA